MDYEVKFDGWRVQVHVEGSQATLYSKNGADFTLRPTIASVPVKSAIIDCELVACDETGMPCFKTLTDLANKAPALCLWCFDLLHLNSVRITLPLVDRKALGRFRRSYRIAAHLPENESRGHRVETQKVGRSLGSDERLAEGQDERAENRGRWELFTAKRS